MTYHDRHLLKGRKAKLSAGIRQKALKGAFSITLFPRSPKIKLGSIDGDWKAVGHDIRKAMRSLETCD